MKKVNLLSILILTVLLGACTGGQKKGTLAGAGATFPLPFYNIAFKNYQELNNINVTYGGVGSGGGIRSLQDKIVDFAGSDAYLSEKEMSEMPAVLHIPSCMGAVVLAYNLPNVEKVNLNGEVIADIYMGKITSWSDSRIAELNPDVELPNLRINPVYRSDGSGTTFVFTDYLSKVSEEWKSKMGVGKAIKWSVGVASKGNPGVAGTVKESVGSIGYIGSEYSFALAIPVAKLRNSAGNFIEPNTASISAAASAEMPDDMRVMITNSSAADAYPISCFTWLLLYKEQAYDNRTKEKAVLTVNLLKWMMTSEAQKITEKVHYAPLPKSAIEKSLNALNSITYNGEKL